jgi:small redox-active disulfide protein 2
MLEIKILGSGCANCKKLEAHTKEAVKSLGVEAIISKVENFKEIAAFGVMRTPALVLDGEVKIVGKVATVEEIEELIKQEVH